MYICNTKQRQESRVREISPQTSAQNNTGLSLVIYHTARNKFNFKTLGQRLGTYIKQKKIMMDCDTQSKPAI
jgi:hypothetical protein